MLSFDRHGLIPFYYSGVVKLTAGLELESEKYEPNKCLNLPSSEAARELKYLQLCLFSRGAERCWEGGS